MPHQFQLFIFLDNLVFELVVLLDQILNFDSFGILWFFCCVFFLIWLFLRLNSELTRLESQIWHLMNCRLGPFCYPFVKWVEIVVLSINCHVLCFLFLCFEQVEFCPRSFDDRTTFSSLQLPLARQFMFVLGYLMIQIGVFSVYKYDFTAGHFQLRSQEPDLLIRKDQIIMQLVDSELFFFDSRCAKKCSHLW